MVKKLFGFMVTDDVQSVTDGMMLVVDRAAGHDGDYGSAPAVPGALVRVIGKGAVVCVYTPNKDTTADGRASWTSAADHVYRLPTTGELVAAGALSSMEMPTPVPAHAWSAPTLGVSVEWDAPARQIFCGSSKPSTGQMVAGVRTDNMRAVVYTWTGSDWRQEEISDVESPDVEKHAAPIPPIVTPDPRRNWWQVEVDDGYNELFFELTNALQQSMRGKGNERHANAKPFTEQPIMALARMFGPGGPGQQVGKKSQEAFGMYQRGEHDQAIAELHGAMVYAAAMILRIREEKGCNG